MKKITLSDKLKFEDLIWCLTELIDDSIEFVKERFYLVCEKLFKEKTCRDEVVRLLIKIVGYDYNFKFIIRNFLDDERNPYLEVDNPFSDYLLDIKASEFLEKLEIVKIMNAYNEIHRLGLVNNTRHFLYNKKVSDFNSLIKQPFIAYNNDSKVSFGEQKSNRINQILKINPDLVVFYVKTLNHFTITYDVLLNPLLVKYLGSKYYEFAFFAIVKYSICKELQELANFLDDEAIEYDRAKSKMDNKHQNDSYYAAHEYFPENENF